METTEVKKVIEALLYSSDEPIGVPHLISLLQERFENEQECAETVRNVLLDIDRSLRDSAIEMRRLASGVRLQVRPAFASWVNKLWERKPPRYSRALLETLALIAYRQPVTRGDIEEIRGVQVRTTTIRTLIERGWIKEVGKRPTPGYPVLYGTTESFLDYFNLQSLDELPPMNVIESRDNEQSQAETLNEVDGQGEILSVTDSDKLKAPQESASEPS